ncbi:LacI family DNA-binding transcriptional regulator [Brachybacterium sp. GCM10030267]|uniref:LacI family DNA-binding transcriptional regulator n=1 Tax=Brachybacterium sp. GCM10030267 TaxID=3273381 RepID=UPI00361CB9AB
MGTIGIAIPESVWSARSEQFYTQVLQGLEDTVVPLGHTVLSRVCRSVDEEIEALRRWAERPLADVVILKDLHVDDPRPSAARELDLPFIVIGDERQRRISSSVTMDNGGTMRRLLQDLRELGHEAIAHVGGPSNLLHSAWRREAYEAFVREHGMAMLAADGDYGAASGAECVRTLLSGSLRPTVIVHDNDAMAIAGCDRAVAMGVAVPQDVSIVAWDDSPACQTHDPPLAVIDRQPHQLGVDLGRAATSLLADPARPVHLTQDVPRLLPRGTVAPRRG